MFIITECHLLTVRDNADQNQGVCTRNGENIKEGILQKILRKILNNFLMLREH